MQSTLISYSTKTASQRSTQTVYTHWKVILIEFDFSMLLTYNHNTEKNNKNTEHTNIGCKNTFKNYNQL